MPSRIAEINSVITEALTERGALPSISVREVRDELRAQSTLRVRFTKGFEPKNITLVLNDEDSPLVLVQAIAEALGE